MQAIICLILLKCIRTLQSSYLWRLIQKYLLFTCILRNIPPQNILENWKKQLVNREINFAKCRTNIRIDNWVFFALLLGIKVLKKSYESSESCLQPKILNKSQFLWNMSDGFVVCTHLNISYVRRSQHDVQYCADMFLKNRSTCLVTGHLHYS